MKDNIEIVYTEVSKDQAYLTCQVVIGDETRKRLGDISEAMAYSAVLQTLYAVVHQNYGPERAGALLEATKDALDACTIEESKEFLDGVATAQEVSDGDEG